MTLTKQQVERWALDVIEKVLDGHPVEDEFVELKRDPIDHIRAARRLGGHANCAAAAGANEIMWIIGVDEKNNSVATVNWKETQYAEFGDWLQRVESRFDGARPELLFSMNLSHDGRTVTAALFDVSQAPFVIKVEGGEVDREVPWRSGTRTRSAMKAELLRVLTRRESQPEVTIIEGEAIFRTSEMVVSRPARRFDGYLTGGAGREPQRTTVELGSWLRCELKLLVVPRGEAVTFVRDFSAMEVRIGDERVIELSDLRFEGSSDDTVTIATPQTSRITGEISKKTDPLLDHRASGVELVLHLCLSNQSTLIRRVQLFWSDALSGFKYRNSIGVTTQ